MTPTASALLATDALTLRIGARTLVADLSLQMRPGELWCVLGPNGSGKTTLLHTLAGLREAHQGQVNWQGRAAMAWRVEDAARWRGLLPQTVHDSFAARALDVVLMGRHPHLARWAWEGDADESVAREALRAVDAQALAERDVTSLSGGEAQRVKLARYLGQKSLGTKILILDEPSTGLHAQDLAGLLNVFDQLTDVGATLIVVEHHLDVIRAADWVIDLGPGAGLEGGRLVFMGASDRLAEAAGSLTGEALRKEADLRPRESPGPFAGERDHSVIAIRGARANNLRNINVDIPKSQLTVVTGVSGSGKSVVP